MMTQARKINKQEIQEIQQKEEFQEHISSSVLILQWHSKYRESSYCQQVHDGVTSLSKQRFSEADTEQRTRVDCKKKTEKLIIL